MYFPPQLAVKHGVKFFETSALSASNVEDAFMTMAADIKRKTEKKLVRLLIGRVMSFQILVPYLLIQTAVH